MEDIENILKDGALELGAELDAGAIGSFFLYLKELKAWNEKMNLTTVTGAREIVTRHFLDSLTPLRLLRGAGCKRLLDIGAGAGFPAIPLKIAEPALDVLLVDSVVKKVHFMRHIIRTLHLASGIRAVPAKAGGGEGEGPIGTGFDCVISRAFASITDFLTIGLPYCRKGGLLVAMKGRSAPRELEDSAEGISALGLAPPQVEEVRVPFTDRATTLLVFKKPS